MQCQNNLKQIGLAILSYEEVRGCLPPGYVLDPTGSWPGNPTWAQILPYIEQGNVAAIYKFNRGKGEAPNYDSYREIAAYQCPSDDAAGRTLAFGLASRSNFVVNMGSDTWMSYTSVTDGPFRWNTCVSIAEIKDGTAFTAMASEVICGKTTDQAADGTWDIRGAWMEFMVGALSYTHRNTPNTSVGDALWYNPGQDIECKPDVDMPCDNSHGTAMDQFHAAAPAAIPAVFKWFLSTATSASSRMSSTRSSGSNSARSTTAE